MALQEMKTYHEHETKNVAGQLASLLSPGDVITLEGELGSGKTVFTKGIARYLGVKQPVTSPTFTIIKEYEGDIPLYHIDAYRLEYADEDIGFEEYFYSEGISVVEWAQFIEDYLPEERLEVTIQYIDNATRQLTFTPIGDYYAVIVSQLFQSFA